MNKLLMAILFLVIPLSAIAGKTACDFPAGMVKQVPPPNAATIAAYQWDAGPDKKGSSDHIQTLRILYKNGDHAVILHSYCTVYYLEINYFRNRQNDDMDAKAIVKLVAGLYSQYYAAPEKVTFSKPLAENITTLFTQQNFDRKKDFYHGLPEDDVRYPNKRVVYSIAYKLLDEFSASGIYSSVIRFDIAIGVAS